LRHHKTNEVHSHDALNSPVKIASFEAFKGCSHIRSGGSFIEPDWRDWDAEQGDEKSWFRTAAALKRE